MAVVQKDAELSHSHELNQIYMYMGSSYSGKTTEH